jgi:hypothetical protein
MLGCLLKLQLVWRPKEGGQIFEWFIETVQKTESMYIPKFKMI